MLIDSSTAGRPDARSTAFRNELMPILQGWMNALREMPGAMSVLSPDGIDVLEVARYDWLFQVAPIVHSLWADAAELRDTSDEVAMSRNILINRLHDYGQLIRRYPTTPRFAVGRIVFIENYRNSAQISAAAARAVAALPDNPGYHFFATRAETAVAVQSVPDVHPVHALLTRPRAARIAARYRSLHRLLSRSAIGVPGREGVGPLRSALRRATERALRRGVFYAGVGHAIVHDAAPALVASTSGGGSFSRGLALAARARGIPSCLIQHGIYNYDEFERFIVHDYHAVWGPDDRAGWQRWGWSPAAIEVTGSPRITGTLVERPDEGVRTQMQVAYFPSRTDGAFVSRADAKRMLDSVVRACLDTGGITLTIKPHPGDRSAIFDAVAGPGVSVERNLSANALLDAAHIAIASTSTVAFEACAQRRDLVLLELPSVPLHPAHRRHGAALFARDAAELGQALEALRGPGSVRARLEAGRAAFVDAMFAGAPHDSAARIALMLCRRAGAAPEKTNDIPA